MKQVPSEFESQSDRPHKAPKADLPKLQNLTPNPQGEMIPLLFDIEDLAPLEQNASSPALAHSRGRLEEAAPKEPPRREGFLSAWLMLLLTLLLAAPALLVEFQRPEVTLSIEARTILKAEETFYYHQKSTTLSIFSFDHWVPRLHGQRDFSSPPGVTWFYMLPWALTDHPQDLLVDQRVLRARLVAIFFALLSVASLFWVAHSIGRTTTASYASLIMASSPLFIYFGRIATPQIVHLGLAMLSIAGASWAIRPLRPMPSTERQFIGWITCGLALGLATLAAGPITLVTIITPIFLMILLCPDRLSHLIGLFASLLIGLLLITPWLMFALQHDQQIWRYWLGQIIPGESVTAPVLWTYGKRRSLLFLLSILPWSLWLITSLPQPFSSSSTGRRTLLFLGWTWFLVEAILILPSPIEHGDHALLLLVPAAAILIAQIFRQYGDLAATGRFPRMWRWSRWPHMLFLAVACGMIPALLLTQKSLVERGYLPYEILPNPGFFFTVGLTIMLVGIVSLSLHGIVKHYPGRVLVTTAIWNILLVSLLWIPITRGRWAHNPYRSSAEKIATLSNASDIYWLQYNNPPIEPPADLLFYAGKAFPWIYPSQLAELQNETDLEVPIILICPLDAKSPARNFKQYMTLPDLKLTLWQLQPALKKKP